MQSFKCISIFSNLLIILLYRYDIALSGYMDQTSGDISSGVGSVMDGVTLDPAAVSVTPLIYTPHHAPTLTLGNLNNTNIIAMSQDQFETSTLIQVKLLLIV